MRKAAQGEGRMKLVLALASIAALILVGLKFAPPKIAHSTLRDRVVEECKFASLPNRTADVIRGNIWDMARAQGLDLYFDKSDIMVKKEPSRIRVQLSYERPVELPGYTYDWRFEIDVTRQILG